MVEVEAGGVGEVGVVAWDETGVKANASRDRVMTEEGLRAERAPKRRQVREWERRVREMDPEENPGGVVAELERVRQRLAEIPRELQQLRKSGLKRRERAGGSKRVLRRPGGVGVGCTGGAGGSGGRR